MSEETGPTAVCTNWYISLSIHTSSNFKVIENFLKRNCSFMKHIASEISSDVPNVMNLLIKTRRMNMKRKSIE